MYAPTDRSASAAPRLRYLEEVAGKLWPAPATVEIGRGAPTGGAIGEFILVPHARRPRLLVPVTRRAAAGAVRRYAEHDSLRARLRSQALSWVLASGFGAGMRDKLRVYGRPDADTIQTHLCQVVDDDVQVSLHLGPPRANRKPVLQLLNEHGRTLGFAKVGINALTDDLVHREGETLVQLDRARLRRVTVPPVLHRGRWNNLEILVLGALPIWRPRAHLDRQRLAEAAWDIAQVGGIRQHRLRQSSYWLSRRSSLAQTGMAGSDTARNDWAAIGAAAETISVRAGDELLGFGSWHGDWTPWNMAGLTDTLLVWDWERFESGVPLGFDILHHYLQTAIVRGRRRPRLAASACLARAVSLLEPFGVSPRHARITAVLYLMEIAIRYRRDGQSDAGAPLGDIGAWLLPALRTAAAEL